MNKMGKPGKSKTEKEKAKQIISFKNNIKTDKVDLKCII